MKVAFFLNIVSPHQLPLAREVARRVGDENFSYVYTEQFHADRARMGWDANELPGWCMYGDENTACLLDADLLYTGLRCFDLIAKRISCGKMTLYCSERWFKPISIGVSQRCRCGLPGWLKLLSPNYFRMAMRIAALLFSCSNFRYLPIGPHAARDMRLICRLYKLFTFHFSLFTPEFLPWGYFVEPSKNPKPKSTLPLQLPTTTKPLRVLWVGRMIRWKRVDTIIRAVLHVNREMAKIHSTTTTSNYNSIALTLVGTGGNRASLEALAGGAPKVIFKDSLPIAQIRDEMRSHDVYVLSSNGEEGWGAALNEAMEEGMVALGTYEAGASAAMLPESHKFHAGDWRRLAGLLEQVAKGELDRIEIGTWSAARAANKIMEFSI